MAFKSLVTPICALLVAAQMSTAVSQQPNPQSGHDPCKATAATIAVLGGAVLGGLLGGKQHRAGGAAIGAAAAGVACLAVNYHAKQVRTAQQVDEDFRNAHAGQAPTHPTVVKYET